MTRATSLRHATQAIRAFARDESGASLVEFSLVVTLFLFLLFGIIDFGRIGYAWVGANKATQLAARIAAVRPPVCAGVPTRNVRGGNPVAFGALCRAGASVCLDPGTFTCQGSDPVTGSPGFNTANEIYTAIRPLMPPQTTMAQLRFSYTFDNDLGFLGGPYVPMVTVDFYDPSPDIPPELDGRIGVELISQLGAFISALTGRVSDLGRDPIRMPHMSVSLPGEDLALGTEG